MSEQMMQAILQIIEKGGTEAATLAWWYLILYSPLLKGVFLLVAIVFLYVGISRIAYKILMQNKKE